MEARHISPPAHLFFYLRASTMPSVVREEARGAAKRRRRYITADRINHTLFRELARAEPGEPRRANSPQNHAARELHGQPPTRVSRTERDDGAQAARSDTSGARGWFTMVVGDISGRKDGVVQRPVLRHPPGFCARRRRREIGLYKPGLFLIAARIRVTSAPP